ncbi:MAG: electron transport complex subunit RsxC [Actinobacteria bacterium]|nr:electron transport complex subunit RsxC [Actinomycetota bacterium]
MKKGYRTFRGGIHPPYNKELSSGSPIKTLGVSEEIIIPLQQNIGAPNDCKMSAGDRVSVGQKIGETGAFVSAPVHSSVAGEVKAVEDAVVFNGTKVKSVFIKPDVDQPEFSGSSRGDLDDLSVEDIRSIARDAGLVGMGGAAFPTHVKLTPPENAAIDTVIINGCECEPFLTCDHRLMLERSGDLVQGARLMMRAVGAKQVIIGIEANKPDAVEKMQTEVAGNPAIEVIVLEVKYPEGAEKQLISAVTGRKVPPGKLPSEVGCLVQNAGTAVALYEAALNGKPLIERVVTVTGNGIANPSNLLVKIGTPISALIDACGGVRSETTRLIMGGPMTGWAQEGAVAPVVKGTSGVVLLTSDDISTAEEHACVRCGKCVDTCPMFLMPNFIVDAVQREEWDKAELWGSLDCFECGCCSYTCPAHIPHVQYVREAKARIAALKKR